MISSKPEVYNAIVSNHEVISLDNQQYRMPVPFFDVWQDVVAYTLGDKYRIGRLVKMIAHLDYYEAH